ncbi:hypothetical protein [Photobacterium kishitanii]|nr:hypothetical protein [Photobacterium kishitanii]
MAKSNRRQAGLMAIAMVALLAISSALVVASGMVGLSVLTLNNQKQFIYKLEKIFFAVEEYYLVNCDSNNPNGPNNVTNPTVNDLINGGYLSTNDKINNPFGSQFSISIDRSTGSTNFIVSTSFNSERYFRTIQKSAQKYFGVGVASKTVYFSRPLKFGQEIDLKQENDLFGGNICLQ